MTLNSQFSKEKAENYFRKIIFVLKAIGVSLDENESVMYRVYSLAIIILVNIMYPILDITELFRQDADAYIGILMYDIPVTLAGVKVYVLLRQRTQVGKLLRKLQEMPFVPDFDRGGEIEQKLVNDCLWITAVQTYAYWVLGMACLGIAVIVITISRIRSGDYHDWKFAFGPLTFLNVTYSPNYEISMIYQSISAFFTGMQFMTVDLLVAALLAHVCFQFKIFQNNVKRLVHNSREEMLKETKIPSILFVGQKHVLSEAEVSAIPWKYLKKHLAQAVNYHLAIISLVDEIERLFSGLLLTVFVSTLLILCLLVYNTSLLSLSDPQIWVVVGGALCVCAQVLSVCFWGERVLQESQQVAEAAYVSNFVGTDLRFQKSLALVIRRAQNPTQITAGKFALICLATFAWIMRTSYSAFMVLRNMNLT